jgi:hypothetical protein
MQNMAKMLIICNNEEHLNELVGTINRSGADVFTVESFAKTSDLNGTTARNIDDIQLVLLSLVGKADAPWDLWVLRHRLPSIPIIVELDVDNPERAYKMIEWGAWDVFGVDENVWDVITRIISSQ